MVLIRLVKLLGVGIGITACFWVARVARAPTGDDL